MLTVTGGNGNGPLRKFDDTDIMWTLLTVEKYKRISRKDICNVLNLGEGSVRSIIQILREEGIVDVYRTGVALTPIGKDLIRNCPIEPVDCLLPDISLGYIQQGLLVRGGGKRVTSGMMQRDKAIRTGALGCCTIILKDDCLMMPPDWNIDEKYPSAAADIRKCGMSEGDALIFGEGEDIFSARKASMTAAMASLGD